MSFKGKVVIVTGAGSGIGAAAAVAFAAEGAHVAMVDINQTKLNNVAVKCEQAGAKTLVIKADVSNKEDIKRIVPETLNCFGKLDVLVNVAGIFVNSSIFASNTTDIYEQVIATNLSSTVYLTHYAAPHLVETKGNIVNISSISSSSVLAEESFAYVTSKAGMDHFTRAIAWELAPKGVRANTVNPGVTRTNIFSNIGLPEERRDAKLDSFGKFLPLQKIVEPEEVANLILFLASDKARSVTGSSYVCDNGTLLVGHIKH